MNILVVDDEIDQLETLRRGLKSRGYGVFEACNADDALLVMHGKIKDLDILLADYLMPGRNGIELLKEVRQKYGSFPVIIMSAYNTLELSGTIRNSDCESFIEKPFTLVQLMREIERLIPGTGSMTKRKRGASRAGNKAGSLT